MDGPGKTTAAEAEILGQLDKRKSTDRVAVVVVAAAVVIAWPHPGQFYSNTSNISH